VGAPFICIKSVFAEVAIGCLTLGLSRASIETTRVFVLQKMKKKKKKKFFLFD
jgi:hypothetical protein